MGLGFGCRQALQEHGFDNSFGKFQRSGVFGRGAARANCYGDNIDENRRDSSPRWQQKDRGRTGVCRDDSHLTMGRMTPWQPSATTSKREAAQ